MKKGFSILEMIIVVIIIGVLLAGIMSFTSSIKTTKMISLVNMLPKIKTSFDKFMMNSYGDSPVYSYKYFKQLAQKNGYSNTNIESSFFKSTFGKYPFKSAFNKNIDVSINNDGKLVISTDLPNNKTCQQVRQLVIDKNVNNSVNTKCQGKTLQLFYSDNN